LEERQINVDRITKTYYRGDVIPPTSRSQVVLALKFSALYHAVVHISIFLYAFFLPGFAPTSAFNGLDHAHVAAAEGHCLFFGLAVAMPIFGLCLLGFSAEFYLVGLSLAWIEIVTCVFVCVFWSCGLPLVLTFLASHLVNAIVGQYFYKKQFITIVELLQELTPPSAVPRKRDQTELSLWPGFAETYSDLQKMLGFLIQKSQAQLYGERCGVFNRAEQDKVTHARAMQLSYMQAISPNSPCVPWTHNTLELSGVDPFGLLDGLLGMAVSFCCYGLSGLWLGRVVFYDFNQWAFAVTAAVPTFAMLVASFCWTASWLEEALGVAIAEKEWLAFDVVGHAGERQDVTTKALDSLPQNSNIWTGGEGHGRLNLVTMWLCVSAVADFIGESHVARLYMNLAVESRYMVEALTPYNFRLLGHMKWEINRWSTLFKAVQALLMASMACVYFGTYFPSGVPVPALAAIAVACFLQSVCKLIEASQYFFTVLGVGKNMTRHDWVSEWILLVIAVFIMINVLVWLYMVPMLKHWSFPLGACEGMNKALFPGICQ